MAKKKVTRSTPTPGHVDLYENSEGSVIPDLAPLFKGLEENFRAGNDPGALSAVHTLVGLGLPIPDWARIAFVQACQRGFSGELRGRSWNEVFGQPRTKKQYAKLMADTLAGYQVWNLVQEAKASGEPWDDLWAEIGDKLGKGVTRVKELYAIGRLYRGRL
jgi:hypothetical protein